MHALASTAVLAALAAGSLQAQNTWIVDADGGPGVDFTDIPPAVAAAADGDRILVYPGDTGAVYSTFTTDKGITVAGVRGMVFGPLLQSLPPVTITNVPARSAFALVGFTTRRETQLRVDVADCQGNVHLEDLHAVEFPSAPFFGWGVAVSIRDCNLVTLHDVESYGGPVVDVTRSTVTVVSCRLGVTSIGLPGGQGLRARQSVVSVTDPRFDSAAVSLPAIDLQQSILQLGGTDASYVTGDFGQPAIHAVDSVLIVDPAVQLNSIGAPPITGNALLTTRIVPATWMAGDIPGGTLTMTHKAPPGETLFALLGLPLKSPLISSLGTLLVDPTQMAGSIVTVPANGLVELSLPIPAGFPPGLSFVTQGAVLGPGGIELTQGSVLVVH